MKKMLVALLLAVAAPAQATVLSTTLTTGTIDCSGATEYPFTFKTLNATDLVVTRWADATPTTITTFTYGSTAHYTVTLSATGGTVTLTGNTYNSIVGTCATGYNLKITRTVPYTQLTSYRTQGTFSPRLHENSFDKLTMAVQQLAQGATVSAESTAAIAAHIASSDDHTGYALLAGRDGGQTLHGGDATAGEDLVLGSNTAHDGYIYFGATSYYDEATDNLTIDDDLYVGGSIYLTGTFYGPYTVGGVAANSTLSLWGSAHGSSEGYIRLGYGDPVPLQVWDVSGVSGHTAPMLGVGLAAGTHPTTTLHVVGDILLQFCDTDAATCVSPHYLYGSNYAAGDLYLSSSKNATKGHIYFGSLAAFTETTQILGLGTASPSAALANGSLHLEGDLLVKGEIYGSTTSGGELALIPSTTGSTGNIAFYYNMDYDALAWVDTDTGAYIGNRSYSKKTVDYPATAADCGGVIEAAAANFNLTLPAIATTNAGCQITFVATGARTAVLSNVKPTGTDNIIGTCHTTAMTGSAYIENTAATHEVGDSVTVVSNGTGDWWIVACTGVWAEK